MEPHELAQVLQDCDLNAWSSPRSEGRWDWDNYRLAIARAILAGWKVEKTEQREERYGKR